VKLQYEALFKTPIDSFFALIPYIFWEVFCEEFNCHAKDYLHRKQCRKFFGYTRKALTINELLTYFGVIVFSMLHPQMGRRSSDGKKSAYSMEESANQQLDYPYGCWTFYANQLNVALQQL